MKPRKSKKFFYKKFNCYFAQIGFKLPLFNGMVVF